jgi:hypothetical protein
MRCAKCKKRVEFLWGDECVPCSGVHFSDPPSSAAKRKTAASVIRGAATSCEELVSRQEISAMLYGMAVEYANEGRMDTVTVKP